jgi:hypothetical protein
MPITDKLNEFCAATDCTGTATQTILGNVIDLTTVRQGGTARPLWLEITFHVAGATTGTWQEIIVMTDADGTLTTGSANEVGRFHFFNAEQVAGTVHYRPIAAGNYLRYLGLMDLASGTYGTKPNVTCRLVMDPQTSPQ